MVVTLYISGVYKGTYGARLESGGVGERGRPYRNVGISLESGSAPSWIPASAGMTKAAPSLRWKPQSRCLATRSVLVSRRITLPLKGVMSLVPWRGRVRASSGLDPEMRGT